ncbi:cyclin-a2-2 [Phtheirospermum japonicum]|uniref:Cyclin-a2-2 n=1 Tax=Phtheirospermum japonicum TaxID=374723 RepID=A0A830C3M7_9LAMI|nr:cyclin-a2-2 [Phtheirospermum japonicum]
MQGPLINDVAVHKVESLVQDAISKIMSMKEWLTSLIDKLMLHNLALKDTHDNIATSPDQVLLSMQQKLDNLCEQFNASTKGLNGDEMFKCGEVELDERRMSNFSDWAPSVASSVDIQLEGLAFEHDINSLRKECEQKDITIKELSTYIYTHLKFLAQRGLKNWKISYAGRT